MTRTRRRRTSRASQRGLAIARAELLFREALAAGQFAVALEAIKLQCSLHHFKIDAPGQPTPIPGLDLWNKLMRDAEQRRVS